MSKDYRLARRHDRFSAFIGRAFSFRVSAPVMSWMRIAPPRHYSRAAAVVVVIQCKPCGDCFTCAARLRLRLFLQPAPS